MVISHTSTTPLPLTGITVEFDTNGSSSGYDSCNRYTGTWQAGGRHVSINEVKSEGLSCPDLPGVMKQEEPYFAIPQNSTGYVTNGEDMALSDRSGKNHLIFKKVFIDPRLPGYIVPLSAHPRACLSRSSTGSIFGSEQ